MRRAISGLGLVLLCMVMLGTSPGMAADGSGCAVSRLVGDATLLHGAGSVPLRPGMTVEPGDHVVTGAGARLEIRCGDGSTLALGESTTLSLAILDDRGGGLRQALLRLIEGIVRIGLPEEHPWSRFDVVTPTAIASARSTIWIVEAKPGDTAVFVARGAVDVSSRALAGTVTVRPGEGTNVRPGAPPTPPKRWGQARVDSAMARTALP